MIDPRIYDVLAHMQKPQAGPVSALRQPQQQQGGFRGLMNRPGVGGALQAMGAAMMAQSDSPGQSFLGNLGRSFQPAMQGYQQGKTADQFQNVLSQVKDPSMRSMLELLGPERGVAAMMTQQDPYLAVAGNVFNRATGRWMAGPPQEPEQPDIDALREAIGFELYGYDSDPADWDWATVNRRAQDARVGEAKAGVAGPEGVGNRYYDRVIDSADTAMDMLPQLATMQALVDGGMESGGLSDITLGLRSVVGPVLGMDTANLNDQQVFNAISNRLALINRTEMPGQLSDNDVRFLRGMMPSLVNTPEGNRTLITVLTRMANRRAELAAEADAYVDEHGEADRGLRRHLLRYANDNDLFGDLLQRAPF